MVGLLFMVVVVAGGGVAHAQPLDSNSQIRLDRGKQAIAGLKIREDLRRNVPAARAAEVNAEHERVLRAVEEAQNQLMMVRNKRHPDVVALQRELSTFQAYLKDLNALIKEHKTAASIDQKLRGEFSEAYWKYRETIEFFMQYYDNPGRYFDYGSETLARAKPAFKEINEGCTTRFQGVTDDTWGMRPDRLMRYSVWCKMAAEGDEWIKRAVTMKAAFYVNQLTESFEKTSKTLAESKGSLGWDQKYYLEPVERKLEFFKFMEKDFKFVGMERPPDEVFAKADAALAKLLAEIKEQVKNWPCEPDGTPMADPFVQKSFTTGIKGLKFLKNYRRSVGWEVTINAFGVPQYRKIGGKAIFKLPKETWCRSQYYTYFQDYQGKGYGQSYFKHGPNTGLSSVCDCR